MKEYYYYCTRKNILIDEHEYTICRDCHDKKGDWSTIQCLTYHHIVHGNGNMQEMAKKYLREEKLKRILE